MLHGGFGKNEWIQEANRQEIDILFSVYNSQEFEKSNHYYRPNHFTPLFYKVLNDESSPIDDKSNTQPGMECHNTAEGANSHVKNNPDIDPKIKQNFNLYYSKKHIQH